MSQRGSPISPRSLEKKQEGVRISAQETSEDSPAPEQEILANFGLERKSDGLVYWQAGSPDHPRNWSSRRKAFDTTVIILLEFYT